MENGSDSQDLLLRVLEQYEREYTGHGDTFNDALDDAWNKAKDSGNHVFRVQEIFITGDNPLSGYGVVISPHG